MCQWETPAAVGWSIPTDPGIETKLITPHPTAFEGRKKGVFGLLRHNGDDWVIQGPNVSTAQCGTQCGYSRFDSTSDTPPRRKPHQGDSSQGFPHAKKKVSIKFSLSIYISLDWV